MQLLKQGAEAKLYKTTYMGRECVVKKRERKKYREPALDSKILRERIRTECNLLARAKKAGIRTPIVWKVNLAEHSITTEFVPGKTLKEELLANPKNPLEMCKEAGKAVGKMHSKNLVHGDLTTSNIILRKGTPVFLDFGMGEFSPRTEDMAVDLLVFKKTFMATHYKTEKGWRTIEKSYTKAFQHGKRVLARLEEVEARARYF